MAKLYTKATWQDEVLAGNVRYDIKENTGTAFKSNMQINLATAITQAGTDLTAAKMNNIENGIDALDTLLSSIRSAATELTISSDAITITQSNHKLQPQSGTTDNLSTINGTVAGQSGILYASDFGTDVITIKHNVGNILCAGGVDVTLSNTAVLWYSDGTKVFIVGGRASIVWIAPTLLNSWENFGNGTSNVGYYKDSNGWVHLRGLIKNGVVNPSTGVIFTFPVGCRPSALFIKGTASNGAYGQLTITANGDAIAAFGSNINFSLDDVHFCVY